MSPTTTSTGLRARRALCRFARPAWRWQSTKRRCSWDTGCKLKDRDTCGHQAAHHWPDQDRGAAMLSRGRLTSWRIRRQPPSAQVRQHSGCDRPLKKGTLLPPHYLPACATHVLKQPCRRATSPPRSPASTALAAPQGVHRPKQPPAASRWYQGWRSTRSFRPPAPRAGALLRPCCRPVLCPAFTKGCRNFRRASTA